MPTSLDAKNADTSNLASNLAPASEHPLQDSSAARLDELEWYQSLPDIQTPLGENGRFLTSAALSRTCSFGVEIFSKIMDNLIRNPNITSSHLFRADIYYDSEKDTSFTPEVWAKNGSDAFSSFTKHMKKELQPKAFNIDGFELMRVLVRRLVPRNPDLDRDMVQTCYVLRSKNHERQGRGMPSSDASYGNAEIRDEERLEKNLIVYLPHIKTEDEMPWYHPKLRALAFLHESPSRSSDHPTKQCDCLSSVTAEEATNAKVNAVQRSGEADDRQGRTAFSLHVVPFVSSVSTIESLKDENRLHRTLQNILQTIARHGAGQLRGYQKRTHHDRLIPQSKLQDTYTRLKQKHAKHILRECWKETTDATKGVFEDLGIAAFLIELWRGMYRQKDEACGEPIGQDDVKPPFPGFVDVGCGNGVLVYVLISEGFMGTGFDARKRKTWDSFPTSVQQKLHRQILVPHILTTPTAAANHAEDSEAVQLKDSLSSVVIHDGHFPGGTFIISNHADELSAWSPLLAYLSNCSFICIPCCSHDLTGSRFRAPISLVKEDELASSASIPNPSQVSSPPQIVSTHEYKAENSLRSVAPEGTPSKAEMSNSPMPKPKQLQLQQQHQQPSSYATLTAYIAHLTRAVGFEAEKEELRIPSTRNFCIVGRQRQDPAQKQTQNGISDSPQLGGAPEADIYNMPGVNNVIRTMTKSEKEAHVLALVERETQRSIASVRELWCARAGKIATPANGSSSSSKH